MRERHMTNAPVTNARTDRFFNFPVTILIFASFMLGMSEFVVVGILPDIASGLKISEVTVGNLVALFAFVYAPCTPIGSALSARFPRFATYLILMGVFLVGNILCALAPNYPVLLIARLLIASVSGTLVAISMTFAPDVTTDKYRTKFIAWVFSGFSIGRADWYMGGQYFRLACHVLFGFRAYCGTDDFDGLGIAAQLTPGENRLPAAVPLVLRPPYSARRA